MRILPQDSVFGSFLAEGDGPDNPGPFCGDCGFEICICNHFPDHYPPKESRLLSVVMGIAASAALTLSFAPAAHAFTPPEDNGAPRETVSGSSRLKEDAEEVEEPALTCANGGWCPNADRGSSQETATSGHEPVQFVPDARRRRQGRPPNMENGTGPGLTRPVNTLSGGSR